MTTPPNREILEHFGVHLVASLGGRLNQHWLVEAGSERLVLRRWGQSESVGWDSIHYEVRLMAHLAALGWPVAAVVAGPTELAGGIWSLAPFLPGEVSLTHGLGAEQQARGRLLAQFHADLAKLPALGQRPGWRRCEAILTDPSWMLF